MNLKRLFKKKKKYEPFIYDPNEDAKLSPECIKEAIEKTKPLFNMGHRVVMTKEEAITFALQYMKVRNMVDGNDPQNPSHIWDCAIDYVVNDIIPYLYGDELD